MKAPRQRGWAAGAALSATFLFIAGSPLFAQVNPSPKPSPSALGAALAKTRTDGVATIAVYTASNQPESVRIWNSFNQGTWARTNRGLVQLVNVSTETEPDLVRMLGTTRFPTVVVYVRKAKGVSHLATIADFGTVEALMNRLRDLDLGLDTGTKRDLAVKQTGLGGDIYPSQQYAPPAPSWPQVQMAPPAQAQPQPTTLMLSPPAQPMLTTSTALVQLPTQNLVLQQAPPQVFMAPTQSAVAYVPQVMSAAPTFTAAPAQAPTGNLFMAAPNLAAAPTAQPSVALSAAPTFAAGAPAVALAAAPTVAAGPTAAAVAAGPPALAAVSNSTLSIPSSGGRTRVRVRGPGLLGSAAARFGERLTQLGRARIETVQETTLEAPLPQSVGGGVTQISTTSTTPVSQGPTTTNLLVPGQQAPEVCKPPCPPSQPPGPLPTPQGSTLK
jgi:hypothetical protein